MTHLLADAQAMLQSEKWQRITITVDTESGVMTTYVGGQQCAQVCCWSSLGGRRRCLG